MPSISISNITFNAPDKKTVGDILNDFDAAIFNLLWRKNVVKTIKKYIELHPKVSKTEIETQLENIPLVFSMTDLDIESEAINIAYKKIETEMLSLGLTPDQILIHAEDLALFNSEIQEQARIEVKARSKVVNSILTKLSEI